ncbi:PDZ and LIM domain protein 3b isoform X2 [Alosa alosa]|uniref:PDZ and LIM domain protein 3b isoform X2 n=1 Tax=Alosa alosa TaxID=278164 RepID=UPI0020151E57|nr:PDZ and LIM domain protein 3b isoform X2 [Alosa alosa]
MPQNVVLDGPAPWGFRLMGGKDFNQPLTVSRVTPGSKASVANLCPGDIILAIDGAAAEDMTHGEAQIKIRDAGNQLTLKIERPETRLWSPAVSADDGKVNPFKINLEAEQQDLGYFEHKFNVRPKPFSLSGLHSTPAQRPMGNVVQGGSNPPQPVTQPVANPGPNQFMAPTDQYNSPIALYSEANVASAQQQAQMSAGEENSSPSGKMLSSIEDSHVYRMLQDNQEPTHEPRQSGSFRALQDYIDSDGSRPLVTRSVRAPVTKPSQAASTLSKLPLCDKCGQGIVGTVVKARDKFRHPACFVCSDCDINLKQKGYFFVEGQLYCEMHARVRTAPVDGHDLIAVFPSS